MTGPTMAKYEFYLQHKIFWNQLDPLDQCIQIEIENTTDERLTLEVDWSCHITDQPPTDVVDGVMVLGMTPVDVVVWAEEAIEWVEPGKTKSFYADAGIVKKMVAASEVMSTDLSRITAIVDGESYEILSGAELYAWLLKEVPVEFR